MGSFRQQMKQQPLKLLLQRSLQDTPKEDECGDRHPQGTMEMTAGSIVHQMRAFALTDRCGRFF
jgi:hypothetical protein